jgi:hypothetical protein
VDEKSGVVTTRKQIDWESLHVDDSFYTIITHTIDSGKYLPKSGKNKTKQNKKEVVLASRGKEFSAQWRKCWNKTFLSLCTHVGANNLEMAN